MHKILTFLSSNRILVLIIIVGILLRFYNLSSIPISLNHDETAIGYNAYSILKTGADEYGNFLPLALKSFGDWKLPLYPLIDMVPIIFLGLNEFSVRLPSAIAGVIAIPLIYVLAIKLFRSKRIALLSALFLSLSPWGVFFSRIAYEANVATTLFLAGLIFFLKFYYEKSNSKLLVLTSLLWGLTIFTYHAFVVFTPLYFMVAAILAVIDKKKIWNKWGIASLLIFLLFIGLSIYSTISVGSINKLSSTSLFDDQHMINERVNVLRGDESSENTQIAKILHNKYAAVLYQIGQNYISSYSPEFLFDKGGEKFLHNVGTFGNFYLFDALLLSVGFITIFLNRKNRLKFLLVWFLVGPIPSAITSDAPSSTRLYLMLPAFVIVASYGANYIISYLENFKRRWFITFLLVIIAVFAVNFIYFIDAYFVHMNYHRAQFFHYGYKEAVELANKYPNHTVEMYDPTNFPYISFLFYNKYDPVKFRTEVVYYPENFGPFYYVKSFDRFNFVDEIDYENMKEDTLYIDYRGIRDEDMQILDPSKKPVFKYFFKN